MKCKGFLTTYDMYNPFFLQHVFSSFSIVLQKTIFDKKRLCGCVIPWYDSRHSGWLTLKNCQMYAKIVAQELFLNEFLFSWILKIIRVTLNFSFNEQFINLYCWMDFCNWVFFVMLIIFYFPNVSKGFKLRVMIYASGLLSDDGSINMLHLLWPGTFRHIAVTYPL